MIGGTEQAQRPLAVLESRRFAIDGQPLEQLAALCARLATRLRFVDLNNQEVDDWHGLFERDESLVLAAIASFAWDARQLELTRLCAHAVRSRIASEVLGLAELLDGWHRALGTTPSAQALPVCESLQRLVQAQLARQLAWLLERFDAEPAVGAALRRRHAGLQPALWTTGPAAPSNEEASRQRLRAVAFSFLHAVEQVQAQAHACLPATLDSGVHEPAAGLLLGFLRLYQTVQRDIDRFSQRHVDFYHRDVLGLAERAAVPDRVHVVGLPESRRAATPVIDRGALFAAGKDADGRPVMFRALESLAVGGARVAALATLYQQRGQAIAPESRLGFVSGARSRWLGLTGPDAAPTPVFGGGPGSRDASLGFALASPLLVLGEGERTIELDLSLAWRGDPLDALLEAAFEAGALAQAALPGSDRSRALAAFRCALGPLFACWLLGSARTLTADECRRLLDLGRELDADSSVLSDMCGQGDEAAGLGEPGVPDQALARQLAFFKYLGDLFDVSVTTPEGWFATERLDLGLSTQEHDAPGLPRHDGVSLCVRLRVEDPAVCACDPALHGQEWPTRLPLLRFSVSPRARLYPVSLLESVDLRQVRVRVAARGVRKLLLQNRLGPLDAGKPFAPFGPLPTTGAYLLLGAPEAATKNLEALTVHLQWSGLPMDAGGFGTHYAGYPAAQIEGRFTVALSLLQSGAWRACGGASAQQLLFAVADAEGRLASAQSIVVDPVSVREFANGGREPLDTVAGARDGVLSLRLNHPVGAFGHADYPSLLSDAVSLRTRRRRAALPRPPYTPELEAVRIDYQASSLLALDGSGGEGPDAERLLHIHPFGVAELYPEGGRHRFGLLPRLGPDGSLAIGLEAPDGMAGQLTLLFQLHAAGAAELRPVARRPPVQWDFLAHDRWQPLDTRHVISDTTSGMLHTGIVTFDLPEGPSCDNSVLGRHGLYWLRASCAGLLETAAPLVSVHAQALTLQRVPGDGTTAATQVPAGSIVEPVQRVPGLAGVLQVGPSTGLRPAEDAAGMRTRAGERLRHKNRASLAWDYERLVLEHFDAVRKVCCFTAPQAGLRPGQVLVVVVPHLRSGSATAAPRLDTGMLQDIGEMLVARASPFVALDVRNASYERVQARCRVRYAARAHVGAVQRELNRVITDVLSPWTADGPGPQLQWQLSCGALERRLRRIEGVQGVGELSLLSVVHDDDGRYALYDTARPEAARDGPVAADRGHLRHRFPWSLALPLDHHLIDTGEPPEGVDPSLPMPTDLPGLEVGCTLVVGPAALPTLQTVWSAE